MLSKFVRCCLASYFLVSISKSTIANDWPQWNGPNRDGSVSIDESIAFDAQPNPLWSVEVGLGYSGPVVAGDRVILMDYLLESGEVTNNAGKRDELTGKERITCFERRSGKQLWRHMYDCPYRLSYPSGPRATPVIHRGFVYTLGSEGDLLCLDMRQGDVQWQVSFNKDFDAQTPLWGHAASPLVYKDRLICMVGGPGSLVVAFDLGTGRVTWQSLTSDKNETGYCSPVIVSAGGVDQLLVWDPKTLHSLDPADGHEHWSESVVPGYGMSILPPVSNGKRLFVSGEKRTSAMFQLDSQQPTAELLWRGNAKNSLYLATSNAIYDGDHIYGADISTGALVCFEAKSGERKWQSALPTTGSKRRRGKAHASAFLIKAGNTYVILSETGDLIHAQLTPTGYKELARFHALDPTSKTMGRDVVWTYPALAHGCVFVRNDRELVCYAVTGGQRNSVDQQETQP